VRLGLTFDQAREGRLQFIGDGIRVHGVQAGCSASLRVMQS
jgi:hypothetical protein